MAHLVLNIFVLSLTVALFINVTAVSVELKTNVTDRLQELHEIQEDLKIKSKQFETMMESEVGKLKEKVEFLETKIQEQDNLLKNCQVATSDAIGSLRNVEENNLKKTVLDPKTCLEARTADPSLKSGMYFIDPDGQGRGDDPIYVYCNMTTGSTSILHDSEDSIAVSHCFEPGCYTREIKYNATLRQMTMLSELSNVCHQSIQVDCYDAAFEFNGVPYAWWNDRNGDPRYFWSGVNNNSSDRYHTCQCGLDGSCKEKSLSCNCDSDLAIELSDVGILLEKDLLPVTKLNFGRTIAPTSINRHTLGRFECNGKVVLNGMPTSCQDLWRIGYILSGIYSIKGSSNKVETVYCDFTKLPGDEELQTWIGYADVKSEPVQFTVTRKSSFSTLNTAISFDQETLNTGNALNTSTGVFAAPRNGTYFFAFSSFSESQYSTFSVDLQLNDVTIANCVTSYTLFYCNVPITLKLSRGDRVQVSLQQGSTNNAIFTGWLLAEDIFQ